MKPNKAGVHCPTLATAQLDDFVAAFETARGRDEQADLAAFLPPSEHPLYFAVLRELVRVDMEFTWQQEQPRRLENYERRFAILFNDPDTRQELAFEEFRLRQMAGEEPSVEEYQRRYGVTLHLSDSAHPPSKFGEGLSTLPKPIPALAAASANGAGLPTPPQPDWRRHLLDSIRGDESSNEFEQVASSYRDFRQKSGDKAAASLDDWCASVGSDESVGLFRELHRTDPNAAYRLAQAVTTWPEVGTEFLGFRLIEELGRGAFAKVYLAEQGDLANRPVALKVAADIFGESQTLARLHHTNIVQIYSRHGSDPFQAVCMPFFGCTTFAEVLRQIDCDGSLPNSGKMLASTVNNHKALTRMADSARVPRTQRAGAPLPDSADTKPLDASPLPRNEGGANWQQLEEWQRLGEMSYVDAVLLMAARLADALAHAHERGIYHRDLKPANILLTDEGQPMLLDFNLSKNDKLNFNSSTASIGGTLPYMSPEHLEAFRGKKCDVDARSDLYSLGLILYELLTGKLPFPKYRSPSNSDIAQMVKDRQQTPPGMRRWNSAVSPAVESIIRKCLEPEPARRYQNARDLREDLERQRQWLPLKHAPEPSLRERASKWRRRHPRLTSLWSVAAASTIIIAILITSLVSVVRNNAKIHADSAKRDLESNFQTAEYLFNKRDLEKDDWEKGLAACRKALEPYQVIENPSWQKQSVFSYLERKDQEHVQDRLGELLLLMAHGMHRMALLPSSKAEQPEQLQVAMNLNHEAEVLLKGGTQSLWRQRAELARLLNDVDEQSKAKAKLKETSKQTARDYYLSAFAFEKEQKYRESLLDLEKATLLEPQSFPAWILRGNCNLYLGRNADALACYTAANALRPESPYPLINRGIVYVVLKLYQHALNDLNKAIILNPDIEASYIGRASAFEGLQDFEAAVQDMSTVIEKLGAQHTRVYLLRYRYRTMARIKASALLRVSTLGLLSGSSQGQVPLTAASMLIPGRVPDWREAAKDFQIGLAQEPTDFQSWIERGLAWFHVNKDYEAALRDFDKALELNPLSIEALQNKAAALAELHRNEESLRTLDEAVRRNPDYVKSRAGRGVVLARMGKLAEAREDARKSLEMDTESPNLYQVAGIYAMTSQKWPEDRDEAFRLLHRALRSGFGWDLLDIDTELNPIRNTRRFKDLVATARDLYSETLQAEKNASGAKAKE